jgi:hypothetical protein
VAVLGTAYHVAGGALDSKIEACVEKPLLKSTMDGPLFGTRS